MPDVASRTTTRRLTTPRGRAPRIDPRSIPAYGLAQAAHHLDISEQTLKSWFLGRSYPTASGTQFFEPVIRPASAEPLRLSFTNLVEAQVLGVIRRLHNVRLGDIRAAVRYVEAKVRVPSPLANQDFLTAQRQLFIETIGKLVNVGRSGQLAMPEILKDCLERIERDEEGLARRLYPMLHRAPSPGPRVVMIDPRVSFGRPVLAGTGIPTAVLLTRKKAGESIKEIAEDYGCETSQVAQAIAWEERPAA
jgi:uncharacterized protein (DUF433 family)